MKKTLVIMIDAFRKDYLSENNTPYLFSLTQEFGFGKLEQSPGFKGTIGFFTGMLPKDLGLFVNYGFNKNEKGINAFLRHTLKFAPKPLDFYALNLLSHFQGNDNFYPAIDLDYLKNFTLRTKKHISKEKSCSVKTLFDVFRENKVDYLFYDFPLIIDNNKSKLHFTLANNDEVRFKKFMKLLNKDRSFYYIHLVDLDPLGHYSGTKSEKLKNQLGKIDLIVERILSRFDFKKDNILIYSDHGMVDIKNIIDIKSKLPKFGQGYIYFLESTMARFWFFNENKKQEVISILNRVKGGKLLTKEGKKRLGIYSGDNFYGDEIFLASPGFLICPNFFQETPCKGMHGYDVSDENEKTIFIINKPVKNKAKMEDLFPTLLDLMNIKKPKNIKGKSLLLKV